MEPTVIEPKVFQEPKVEEVKVEPKVEELKLPEIKSPICIYNKDTKVMWVGIPISVTDIITASFILDSAKLNYLRAFQMEMKEMEEKKAKIVTPGMLNRMRENFVRKLQK